MSTTLTYGFVVPSTGETGATFFPILEDNIERTNNHDHDGVNSKKISSSGVKATTATVLAASWVAGTGGMYSQTVTMPSGMLYDDYYIQFKDASGNQLQLTVEKLTATTYSVTVNDNTLEPTVYYTS